MSDTDPRLIADYVAVPEPLWLDLVEGFLPYLADDEKLTNAWVAIGERLDSNDDVPWKKVAENLSKELTMERNWRIRLQEELWAQDPSKDPRRDGHGPEDYPREGVLIEALLAVLRAVDDPDQPGETQRLADVSQIAVTTLQDFGYLRHSDGTPT